MQGFIKAWLARLEKRIPPGAGTTRGEVINVFLAYGRAGLVDMPSSPLRDRLLDHHDDDDEGADR